jgi:arylsulfatase A-like enzyme
MLSAAIRYRLLPSPAPHRAVLASIVILAGFLAASITSAAERPNILFVFSDDQRADTIAALGNQHIRTPNLDRLVKEGTVLKRAYCMGAMGDAVCVASRAMLLTGRTLFRIRPDLRDQPTWPEQFAAAGYTTFISGKWHNGPASLTRAFDQGKAVFLGGMGDPYALPLGDIEDHKAVYKGLSRRHSVEIFTDCAVDFIKHQPKEKPFLAYVAFNLPHDPRVAPAEYHKRYNADRPPLPANYLPEHPFNNGFMVGRDEELASWPRTPDLVRQHLADYYSAVEFVDAQLGRLLEALRQSGQYERTIIVFTSDHGLAIGSHGLFGKQNLYEHSMRPPLIFVGPGIPSGKSTDALCYLLDIFPTLGELAGVEAPRGNEGKSLRAVIAGKAEKHRESIFTAFIDVQRAVTDGRWKLIAYPHVNKMQLFDLAADPNEMHDVAAEPANRQTLTRLKTLLETSQTAAGDKQPLTSDKPLPLEFKFPEGNAVSPQKVRTRK